jgi:hypothetical protein
MRLTAAAGISPEIVARWLAVFVTPSQVTELRAIGVRTPSYRRPHTVAGFFDGGHLEEMARQALRLTPHAEGVYFVPNPLDPALLARRANRVDVADPRLLACDANVTARNWLLVDCDPVRVAGVGSSDAEKELTRRAAQRAWAVMRGSGWPEPVVADSGNGYHLLFPVSLAAGDADKELARRVLERIADHCDTDLVKVDRVVFNASRIVKLYGTLARKGDDVPERPHRVSRVLHIPAGLSGVAS